MSRHRLNKIPPPVACPVCDGARISEDREFVVFACGQKVGLGNGTWNIYYGYCANTVSTVRELRREIDDLRTRVGMLED